MVVRDSDSLHFLGNNTLLHSLEGGLWAFGVDREGQLGLDHKFLNDLPVAHLLWKVSCEAVRSFHHEGAHVSVIHQWVQPCSAKLQELSEAPPTPSLPPLSTSRLHRALSHPQENMSPSANLQYQTWSRYRLHELHRSYGDQPMPFPCAWNPSKGW